MEQVKRVYAVELTDAQLDAVRAHNRAESDRLERLSVELREGSADAQKLGASIEDQALGFRAIDLMRGEDDLLSLGQSLVRRWYYSRVRGLAEYVLRACVDGEVFDLGNYLHETIDGTDIVVYTYKADAALMASDNDSAFEDSGMDGNLTAEQRAYFALEADVRESMQSMIDHGAPEGLVLPEGFDLDDDSTWTASASDVETTGEVS